MRHDTAGTSSEVLLTPADAGPALDMFTVGLEASTGDHVWVDEVRLGW